jgi:hypothetical protein
MRAPDTRFWWSKPKSTPVLSESPAPAPWPRANLRHAGTSKNTRCTTLDTLCATVRSTLNPVSETW